MGYGDLGADYDRKIMVTSMPAYAQTVDKTVKIAGPHDSYDLKVRVTSGWIGHEYDPYDWEVRIAGPYDNYDLVVKVVNPQDLPREYR